MVLKYMKYQYIIRKYSQGYNYSIGYTLFHLFSIVLNVEIK